MPTEGGFIQLGNNQLLVLDTTGVPYSIRNIQGETLLGGTPGPAAPTFKFSVGGVTLVAGDQLVGGASTTGTPGSGSFVGGFAVLDSSGNLIGNWIPRTGTLNSLEALALNAGELASATDIPAVVQGTGTVGVNFAFFPFGSTLTGSVSGTGSVATTIPCTASIIRLTLASAVTGLVATLQSGYIDGQELEIEIVSTGTSVTSVSINGITVVGTGHTITSLASVTSATAFRIAYKWNASSTSWIQITPTSFVRNAADEPGAIDLGNGNSAIAPFAVTIGTSNVASQKQALALLGGHAYGPTSAAIGPSASAFGTGAFSVGNNVNAYGQNSFALGIGASAYGDDSIALSGAVVYGNLSFGIGSSFGASFGASSYSLAGATGNQGQLGAPYTISSASGGLSSPSIVLSTVAGLEVGQAIAVPVTIPAVGTVIAKIGYIASTISTLNVGTRTITTPAISPAVYSPAITAIATGQPVFECQGGLGSVSLNTGSLSLNQGELAISGALFSNPGDGQSAFDWLGISTSNATPAILTTNFAPVNSNLQFGNSNRLQIAANQGLVIEMTLTAKQSGISNMTTWKRRFLACNTGGTITLSSVQVIGTDIGIGTSQWTTTWVASPPFTITANNTQTSVDVQVTGIAATNINWLATCEVISSLTV
jgi:Head domain of trimeric autotransporter adhesin